MQFKGLKDDLYQLIKYGFFGIVSTAFNLVLFYVMIKIGIHYIVTNIVSYSLAVILSYFLNDRYVFSNQNAIENINAKTKKLMKFSFIRVGVLAVDTTALAFFVDFIGIDIIFSRVILSFVLIMATYILNKAFVFTNNEKEIV